MHIFSNWNICILTVSGKVFNRKQLQLPIHIISRATSIVGCFLPHKHHWREPWKISGGWCGRISRMPLSCSVSLRKEKMIVKKHRYICHVRCEALNVTCIMHTRMLIWRLALMHVTASFRSAISTGQLKWILRHVLERTRSHWFLSNQRMSTSLASSLSPRR